MEPEKRIVVTKRKTYEIPADQIGSPIEDYFKNTELPDDLKGAKVYDTEDGPVIARQLPDE